MVELGLIIQPSHYAYSPLRILELQLGSKDSLEELSQGREGETLRYSQHRPRKYI